MIQDLSGERGTLHGGDVSGPVAGSVQMTQLPHVFVGEVQRHVPGKPLASLGNGGPRSQIAVVSRYREHVPAESPRHHPFCEAKSRTKGRHSRVKP